MDRLLRMDKDEYLRRMRQEGERILGQVADAVNDAADGNVINGSEMQVRELMDRLRQLAYETAVQMRIDSTESSFSPSEEHVGAAQAEQGPLQPQCADGQRANRHEADPLARGGRGQRHAAGSAAGSG